MKLSSNDNVIGGVSFSRQFPPANDHPIVQLSNGAVLSRYGDAEWKFPARSGGFIKVHFGNDSSKKIRLNDENGRRLRELLYFLYAKGLHPIRPSTLRHHFNCLLGIFRLCDEKGILIDELENFPRVIDEVSARCLSSKKKDTRQLLLNIYYHKEDLGFFILSPQSVNRAFLNDSPVVVSQTPYIPTRIWTYQTSRLSEALLDFVSHKNRLRQVFIDISNLYLDAFGVERAFEIKQACDSKSLKIINHKVRQYISDAGLDELLSKWVADYKYNGFWIAGRTLSKYLSAMVFIGNVYIANYSGLRKQELQSLRASSLYSEDDNLFGEIFLIRGRTTKTISDDDAKWITSSKVKVAFEVLKEIAELRIWIAKHNPKLQLSEQDVIDPLLSIGSYEPWGRGCRDHVSDHAIFLLNLDYSRWKERCPGLFSIDELIVTAEDMHEANCATDSLNGTKVKVGQPWGLSLHQLRRTLAVNAACSGLVSNRSLQYELKHLTPQMSFYYGRNSSRFTFDRSMVNEFRDEVFDGIAREALLLKDDRFISPLGEANKNIIVSFMTEGDLKKISGLARKGEIALRPTMAGLCLSTEFCPFGGIDNIEECMSCSKALFDRTKRPMLASLLEDLREMHSLEEDEALQSSTGRQVKFLEKLLYEVY